MIKKLFFFTIFLFFTASIIGAYGLYYTIVLDPGSEIDASNIEAILGQESPVFYSDNMTKLGVFFDEAHRQYVKYEEIPHNFVNALVAAEDNRFFEHFGFDAMGITRAMLKNLEAGRVVQGGSTLTQQTAKNLFKRTERSFQAKLKELLFALRLEYHYPKEKIFEFYANQFYVSGNGHGLAVAARYYFDKKTEELDLAECAFIAGSVKRPNYYNPFIKKTEEAAELARSRAKDRQEYVLDKMIELGMIDQDTYATALLSEIEFNKGQVGYSLDYVMDLVKDAMASTEVLTALEKHGIDNVSTSGIRIVTTVDKYLQDRALYALRHDLSRLDVLLRGYEREEVQAEYLTIEYSGDTMLEEGAFLFGTVESVSGSGDNVSIVVDFGHKLGSGVLDAEGLKTLVEARTKWSKGRWAKVKSKDLKNLVEQFQPEDRIWVSVREVDEQEGIFLDLEKFPEVQGGSIVLQNGAVLAMVGGVENRFYNRAVYAKRTMGSSFKPFVYAAAMQLGWNSTDLLKNSRDVFVYHNQPYFPRPDHTSPFEHVSMSWAGTKSENLASVWLLAHLCDYLNPIQFKDLAEHLDLTPRVTDGDTEPYRAYRSRIRDEYGIVVTTDTLNEAAFKAAVRNSEADFLFEDLEDDYSYLKGLNYGLNHDRFRKQLDRTIKKSKKASDRNDLQLKKNLLSKSYLALKAIRSRLDNYIEQVDGNGGFYDSAYLPSGQSTDILLYDYETRHYLFQPQRSSREDLEVVTQVQLQAELYGLSYRERQRFWEGVYLYGEVSAGGLDLLSQQVEVEYQRLERELPYSFDVLANVDDFRIFVGLKYLIALAREMGIKSNLQPVLSFPLGSNVVSLLETTRMYEGLVTGMITSYGEEHLGENSESLLIIDRIESPDGEVLYRPEPHVKTVLGAKERMSVSHILENVVKYGTGQRAQRGVHLSLDRTGKKAALDFPIPVMGKTGTANDYTNASFFGYLPAVSDGGEGLVLKNGFAVGAYVGFDDNESMRKDKIRISGSSGALPTWIDIVNTLVHVQGYADNFDQEELSFNGLHLVRESAGQINLAADPDDGGSVASPIQIVSDTDQKQPSILTFGTVSGDSRYIPARRYKPFWRAGDVVQ